MDKLILLTSAFLALFAALSIGCHSPSSGSEVGGWQDSVIDVDWRLESINGDAVLNGSEVTLRLGADGKAAGSGGANRWFASYERNGVDLKFGPAGVTQMFLDDPPGLMDQERRFVVALGTVTKWTLVDGQLLLAQGDGRALVFARKQ